MVATELKIMQMEENINFVTSRKCEEDRQFFEIVLVKGLCMARVWNMDWKVQDKPEMCEAAVVAIPEVQWFEF